MKWERRLLAISAVAIFASCLAVLLWSRPADCEWCPPIPCYGGGQCGDCVCIRDAYPEPGYCASLEG